MANRLARHTTKKKLIKSIRRRRRGAIELSQQADEQIDKLLLRRISRLRQVRRFISLWLLLLLLLIWTGVTQLRWLDPYYQTLAPTSGGIFSEGLIGSFTNANPIYASGAADSAISKLIFSGLFEYNSSGQLVGDLATKWGYDKTQTVYTIDLRKDVRWQDGTPFTAADVVFTYQIIQNTESQSPLYTNWQGITVAEKGPFTVTFSLSHPLSSFPYNLTNGIVPKHLLDQIPVAQMRSAGFNTDPVGTGPFKWKFVDVTGGNDLTRQQRITLAPYGNYWQGKPKLDGLNLITYRSDQQMIKAFSNKQIQAMSGLETIPPDVAQNNNGNIQVYHIPLTAIVMAFYNNSTTYLGDLKVRKALTLGVDRKQLLDVLGYPNSLVSGPILPGQVGYNSSVAELSYNLSAAKKTLDSDGWKLDKNGMRSKGGKVLTLNLVSQDSPEYMSVTQFLQRQWHALGVNVEVHNFSADDMQSSIIPNHNYDILLYGINVGSNGDLFPYWDSSQANPNSQGHLNLSEYKSTAADLALESARTHATTKLRAIKYQAFVRVWRQDSPALALYQPTYLYISRGPIFGFTQVNMNSASDRFNNVQNWMIRERQHIAN